LLLYGDQSHTADIYLNAGTHAPNWREDFPKHIVAAIPGAHGELFIDANIGGLAQMIRSHVNASEDVRLTHSRWRFFRRRSPSHPGL
jgi:hypothetical protein